MAQVYSLGSAFETDLDAPPPARRPLAPPGTEATPNAASQAVSSQKTVIEHAAAANPALSSEVTFLSGLNPDGTLAFYSYAAWNNDRPATYTGGYTLAYKWYANDSAKTAGTPGGTVTYAFNTASGWTTDEMAVFTAGLALWSAVANISFSLTSDYADAGIQIVRGGDSKAYSDPDFAPFTQGAGRTDGTELLRLEQVKISIDTSVAGFGPIGHTAFSGNYPLMTVLHEEGHALGLGHGGPYNGTKAASQQYSPYDTRLWSLMSYFNNTNANLLEPVYPTSWGGNYPTTPMIADILAIQQIYGRPGSTPLSGGQVFGFNSNITGDLGRFFDFSLNTSPVLTLWDSGANNTLDLSGTNTASTINLNPGTFSSTHGLTNNIAIAFDTRIDRLIGSEGQTNVTGNSNGNYIDGGAGNDVILGGSGDDTLLGGSGSDRISGGGGVNSITGGSESDTAVYALARVSYGIDRNHDGSLMLTGGGISDTLREIEYLEFADQTIAVTSLGPPTIMESGATGIGGQQMPIATTPDEQVTYITGITSGGVIASQTAQNWDNNTNPATYASSSNAGKWGVKTAGTGSGTINYYFHANAAGTADDWSAAEQNVFNSVFALYSAIANVTFSNQGALAEGATDPTSGLILRRGTTGSGAYALNSLSSNDQASGTIGGSTLWNIPRSTINIETGEPSFALDETGFTAFTRAGGHGWTTLIHEVGHALGLGHAGPYPVSGPPPATSESLQNGVYDTELYTVMSYIHPSSTTLNSGSYPVASDWGTVNNGPASWKRNPVTVMPLDIMAIQRLYGTPTSTPLSGGQTYGFNTNIGGLLQKFFDFTINTSPVITLWNAGSNNTLDLSGYNTASTVNLTAGSYSSVAGLTNNVAIAYNTAINTAIGGSGNDTLTGNTADNTLQGNGGTNSLNGGDGNDTARYGSARAAYGIVRNSNGTLTVTATGLTDTLTSIEFLAFADQTISAASVGLGRAKGDFDGDGKSDILLQNASGQASIWFMNGSTVTSAVGLANPGGSWSAKGTGDLDGDGKSDILFQNSDGTIKSWLMNGSTILGSTDVYNPGTSWKLIGAGDFNGDGKSDILLQNESGQASIWLMNGSTVTSAVGLANPGSSWSVKATGDLDGDGKSDILFQNSDGTIKAWLMNGTVIASPADIYNPGASWKLIGSGDFNGDGKSDILLQNESGQASIWLMNGTTVTSAVGLANPGTTWSAKGMSDLDGDGKSDILFQHSDGAIKSWLMNGTVIASSADVYNPGTSWKLIGGAASSARTTKRTDFDGDGKSDILLQNTSGQASVWFMNGSTVTSAVGLANPGGSWSAKGTGDLDGDGKSDILFQNSDGTIKSWLMNGSTIVSSTNVYNPGASWQLIGAGDFNGDGKSDILLQNDSRQASIWFMDGSTVTSAVGLANPGGSWNAKATGDLDGDGKSDILFQHSDGTIKAWLMNGSTIVSSTNVYNPGSSWHLIGAADFNADSKSDILLQNDSGQASIWFMNGSTVTSAVGLANPGSSWSAKGMSDLDGDGKSDILFQNSDGTIKSWLMNGSTIVSSTNVYNPGASWQLIAGGG